MRLETLWRAKVGEPWSDYVRVMDAETGEEVPGGVVEANAEEGWFVQFARDENGRYRKEEGSDPRNPTIATERVEKAIYLDLKDDAPAEAVEWFKIQDPPGYKPA